MDMYEHKSYKHLSPETYGASWHMEHQVKQAKYIISQIPIVHNFFTYVTYTLDMFGMHCIKNTPQLLINNKCYA